MSRRESVAATRLQIRGFASANSIKVAAEAFNRTQVSLATMVADTAPPGLRGTAFGVFNLAAGVAMLVASGLAGWLWDRVGGTSTFVAGAAIGLVTLAVLAWKAPPETNT